MQGLSVKEAVAAAVKARSEAAAKLRKAKHSHNSRCSRDGLELLFNGSPSLEDDFQDALGRDLDYYPLRSYVKRIVTHVAFFMDAFAKSSSSLSSSSSSSTLIQTNSISSDSQSSLKDPKATLLQFSDFLARLRAHHDAADSASKQGAADTSNYCNHSRTFLHHLQQAEALDVNGDGHVCTSDLLALVRHGNVLVCGCSIIDAVKFVRYEQEQQQQEQQQPLQRQQQ